MDYNRYYKVSGLDEARVLMNIVRTHRDYADFAKGLIYCWLKSIDFRVKMHCIMDYAAWIL